LRDSMPIPCVATTNSSQVNRQVFCRYYGDCLDQAIEEKWASFSCEKCESYEDERLASGQRDDEFSRYAVLAYLSFSQ